MDETGKHKIRRLIFIVAVLAGVGTWLAANDENYEQEVLPATTADENSSLARDVLEKLEVKGRAPKTGYKREEFYTNWPDVNGCDARNVILARDLSEVKLDDCVVLSGVLDDPYTGEKIEFKRGKETSGAVQIDHVVALSDAWQKGIQYKDKALRKAFASDPLNLLAVDGPANMQKGDGDAATWLPANKAFRCTYVARQISVKYKYEVWVTEAEKEAMVRVLAACPDERVVGVDD
jgi:hypothetical protein